MKLQPASKKELARISAGTLALAALETAVFALLGLAGVYSFGWEVVVSALGGSAVAILNFALLCLTVQATVGTADPKQLRAKVQASYTARLLLQGLWCLLTFLAPCFRVIPGVLPLFFPNLVILWLRARGKITVQSPQAPPAADPALPARDPGPEHQER